MVKLINVPLFWGGGYCASYPLTPKFEHEVNGFSQNCNLIEHCYAGPLQALFDILLPRLSNELSFVNLSIIHVYF